MEIDIVDSDGPISSEIVGLEQLRARLPKDWFAYANREIVTGKKQTVEIDLIIVGSDRIYAVDLKNWNGVLEARQGRWIQNGIPRGRSASKKVRENARKIATYLQSRLPRRVGSAFVVGLIVATGDLDYSSLPEADRDVILTVDEIFALADQAACNRVLEPVFRSASDPKLTTFRTEFDLIFRVGSSVRSRQFRPFGFNIDPIPITLHHSGLYKEFSGTSETLERGIVRSWNFQALPLEFQEITARRELLSREQKVRQYLADRSEHFETDDVLVKRLLCDDDLELFESPQGMERIGTYLGKHRQRLSFDERIDKFKAIVATIAAMHTAECGHTDLGAHSLWMGVGIRHKLSNLASAQYPSSTTLGPLRFLLSNMQNQDSSSEFNPRVVDIRSLGRIGQAIFEDVEANEHDRGRHPPIVDFVNRIAESANLEGLTDAAKVLEALNAVDRRLSAFGDRDNASGVLERVLTPIVPFVTYSPQGEMRTRGDEIFYYSLVNGHRCVVKIWNSISSHSSKEKLYSVLSQFLKVLQIKDSSHASFPRIDGCGIGPAGAFLSYYFEDGQTLDVGGFDISDALMLSAELAGALSAMHEDGLSHGDLSPANVLFRWADGVSAGRRPIVRFLDFIQVNVLTSVSSHTPRYSPKVQCNDPFQRDAYALIAICHELLSGFGNSDQSPKTERALGALASEQVDGWLHPAISLARVRAIIDEAARPTSAIGVISVPVATRTTSSTLEPDGDIYYVNFVPAKGQMQATLYIHGLKEHVRFPVSGDLRVMADQARVGSVNNVQLARMRSYSKPSQLIKGTSIDLLAGKVSPNLSSVEDVLQSWLDAVIGKTPHTDSSEEILRQLQRRNTTQRPTNRTDVWNVIAEAEESIRLEAVATGASLVDADFTVVPVAKWQVPTDRSIAHTVYRINKRGDEVEIGDLEISRSTSNMLAIQGSSLDAIGHERGTRFVVRNRRDESARSKKVNAAKRLIAGKAARPGLLEEFNKLAIREFSDLGKQYPSPTRLLEADLDGYGLNIDQRRAVLGAVNGDGLFLLQGPPGTGKTKTIAALVHAIVTKLNSRRVLVASQTHEAVNNAAVRIAEVFREYGTPLDLVRVGNEDDIADELMSVHTAALRRDFVGMLEAEWINRVSPIGRELGLDLGDIEDLLWFSKYVLSPIARASSWEKDQGDSISDDSRSAQLKDAARSAYAERTGEALEQADSLQQARLAVAYWVSGRTRSASPSQCIKFLSIVGVILETLQRLRSERSDSTFGEFLVKTRAVACGTCVGIGSNAYKLSDKIFDWVVIDEAARCTPTELAVALQSARRVILVGDHMQLPPFIAEPMRKYLQKKFGARDIDDWLTSDFQEMFDKDDKDARTCSSLWAQYRMLEPISTLVSDLVYDGKLICEKREESPWLRGLPVIGPAIVTLIDTTDFGDDAYDNQPVGETSFINESEADVIAGLIGSIARDASSMKSMQQYLESNDQAPIGVICTYAAQVQLIKNKLIERDLDHLLAKVVKLGTVDSYQGRENVIVIVSLVRSGQSHAIGHVDAIERVNVALSRAKERLVIVGDGRTWTSKLNALCLAGQTWKFLLDRLDGTNYHHISAASEPLKSATNERS